MRLVRYSYPTFRNLTPSLGFQRSAWSGLENEIDRLFETAVSDFDAVGATNRFPADLFEDNNNIYVRAELPGVNREDLNVEMTDGTLTLSASRKTPGNDGAEGETFTFTRSVEITEEIQSDKVSAHYENGVLTVTLPKREEAKPRKITVAVK